MFGHNDQSAQKQKDQNENGSDDPANDPSISVDVAEQAAETVEPTTVADPTPDDPSWQHPGTPVDKGPAPIADVVSPAGGFPRSTNSQLSTNRSIATEEPDQADDLVDPASNDLIEIKQHALTELSPLIDQLDQEPDERFRTLMMMIQASDDQSLVKAAYEAAHSIEDEKVRAQALLDIINEINYFTQQQES